MMIIIELNGADLAEHSSAYRVLFVGKYYAAIWAY